MVVCQRLRHALGTRSSSSFRGRHTIQRELSSFSLFTIRPAAVGDSFLCDDGRYASSSLALAGLAAVTSVLSYTTEHCRDDAKTSMESAVNKRWTPSEVATENFDEMVTDHPSGLPVFTADQVAEKNGDDDAPIWVTYGGHVYDITEFIKNHPG